MRGRVIYVILSEHEVRVVKDLVHKVTQCQVALAADYNLLLRHSEERVSATKNLVIKGGGVSG